MEPVGFEPTTFRLQGECSPNWAMSPWFLFYNFFHIVENDLAGFEPSTTNCYGALPLSYKSLGCHHMRPTYDWFLLLQIAKLFATRTPPTGADPATSTVTGWRLCCLSSETHWLFTYTIRLTFGKTRQLFVTFLIIMSLLCTIISRQGRTRTYDVSDVADLQSAAFASRLPTENACTWIRTKNLFRLRGGCHTFRRHKHK